MAETQQQQQQQEVVPLPFDDFTNEQAMAISLVLRFSAVLSIIGSTVILYRILGDKETREMKLNMTYHRIMVFMSVNDVIASLCFFVGSSAMPRDSLHDEWIWGNIGNTASCDIQGYMLQASVLSVCTCTTCLSIYFLLFVRYNWTELRLKMIERIMHFIVALCYVIPIAPLLDGSFNEISLFCWIMTSPMNCDMSDDVECIRGNNVAFYRNFFLILPISICLTLITVSMVKLYAAVRQQEKVMAQYYFSSGALSIRSRNVFKQALWFIGSFSSVWIPSLVMSFLTRQGVGSFGLTFLVSLMLPLQGFFNAIIYTHAKISIKKYVKRLSRCIRNRSSSTTERNSSMLQLSGLSDRQAMTGIGPANNVESSCNEENINTHIEVLANTGHVSNTGTSPDVDNINAHIVQEEEEVTLESILRPSTILAYEDITGCTYEEPPSDCRKKLTN